MLEEIWENGSDVDEIIKTKGLVQIQDESLLEEIAKKVIDDNPDIRFLICNILKEKKFKLAILSNGTPSLLDELVKSNHLDNLFDDIFSIEQVGVYKPSSRVYDMPIKKYNINKSEVAFLSANTWDVSGGGNYGYQSIWVNRNNNIFDNLDFKPKYQITDLNKLIQLV